MTLKECKKEYQGKYYRSPNGCFRFVRVFKENNAPYYSINVEYIDTKFNTIDDSFVLFFYPEDKEYFDSLYKRITKKEFCYIRKGCIPNYGISVTPDFSKWITDVKLQEINDLLDGYLTVSPNVYEYVTASTTEWPSYMK